MTLCEYYGLSISHEVLLISSRFKCLRPSVELHLIVSLHLIRRLILSDSLPLHGVDLVHLQPLESRLGPVLPCIWDVAA